jgi:hypothetical protein
MKHLNINTGGRMISWKSEDRQFPGVYSIDEEQRSISFNGLEIYRIDETEGFLKADVGCPGRLDRLCLMYLSEWLYSFNNPVTEKEFQEMLTEIQV